ncbi:hypothetical protein NDU88_005819 [Pleurodeles waltl]|uniref:Uncharacterized protein n=1 Tax=Pleurodeles waltl TaxID=8319 RepID=A0AAV7SMS5_PLEWA|nr:hypothetical protein NDU88_005819 [Pleurodeles waltl]
MEAQLARLARKDEQQIPVLEIQGDRGFWVSMQWTIIGVFQSHLGRMYAVPNRTINRGAEHLALFELPHLTVSDHNSMDALISRKKILVAIRSLRAPKTPDSDDLPAEFYHRYVDTVADKLLGVYHKAF